MTPCSLVGAHEYLRETYYFHHHGSKTENSTLKIKALCSCETLVPTYKATAVSQLGILLHILIYFPEDSKFHIHRFENPKSHCSLCSVFCLIKSTKQILVIIVSCRLQRGDETGTVLFATQTTGGLSDWRLKARIIGQSFHPSKVITSAQSWAVTMGNCWSVISAN
jgi:hypothetical protein